MNSDWVQIEFSKLRHCLIGRNVSSTSFVIFIEESSASKIVNGIDWNKTLILVYVG